MAASIEERIAAAVKTALLAAPQMTEIAGRVERARSDSISADEGETINVSSDALAVKSLSNEVDDKELTLNLELYVRGVTWETLADAIAVQAHARVMGHNYYTAEGIKLAQVRLVDADWVADQGDQTPGKRTMKYAFRFLSMVEDITKQP